MNTYVLIATIFSYLVAMVATHRSNSILKNVTVSGVTKEQFIWAIVFHIDEIKTLSNVNRQVVLWGFITIFMNHQFGIADKIYGQDAAETFTILNNVVLVSIIVSCVANTVLVTLYQTTAFARVALCIKQNAIELINNKKDQESSDKTD